MGLTKIGLCALAAFAFAWCAALPVRAAEPAPGGATTPAVVVQRVLPTRPPVHPLGPQTGAVTVRFTIGADGTTSELKVAKSSGPVEFRAAALDALKQWRFIPAQQNGRPVAQPDNEVTIDFGEDMVQDHESLKGTSVAASNRPLTVQPALDKAAALQGTGDHAGALALLDEAAGKSSLTPSDQAALALARAVSLNGMGQKTAALAVLREASAEDAGRLPPASREGALRLRLELEGLLGHAADAKATYALLTEITGALPTSDPAADIIAQLDRALAQPAPIAVAGELYAPTGTSEGTWSHALTRRKIGFEAVTPGVKTFVLQCAGKTHSGAVNTEETWSMPPAWGACRVEVKGAAGATFSLVEYPK